MNPVFEEMAGYLKLAQACRQQSSMPDRDRALLLAAINASLLQMHPLADLCRKMILQNNPGHMLRRFDDVSAALNDSEFHTFAKQVRRKFPPEKIDHVLADLNYQCPVRRSDCSSESEYAAALLGVDVPWIKEHFGNEP